MFKFECYAFFVFRRKKYHISKLNWSFHENMDIFEYLCTYSMDYAVKWLDKTISRYEKIRTISTHVAYVYNRTSADE